MAMFSVVHRPQHGFKSCCCVFNLFSSPFLYSFLFSVFLSSFHLAFLVSPFDFSSFCIEGHIWTLRVWWTVPGVSLCCWARSYSEEVFSFENNIHVVLACCVFEIASRCILYFHLFLEKQGQRKKASSHSQCFRGREKWADADSSLHWPREALRQGPVRFLAARWRHVTCRGPTSASVSLPAVQNGRGALRSSPRLASCLCPSWPCPHLCVS